ncbi:MAG: nuclear transport factor 2 family protein [Hyphomicrobiaceae bacterium]|nr:nuclear transport factor 2 family protein [Hyphomicrobiaceae bacterium]
MFTEAKSPEAVLTEVWRAWREQDKSRTLAHCADDVVFAIYVPEHVLAFGGETRGRRSVSDRLQTIIDQFETLAYEGVVHGVDGDTVHGVVHFCFRHRATGQSIEGDMRQVVVVRDGLIVELKEYHDLNRVIAFMRLVSEVAHRT